MTLMRGRFGPPPYYFPVLLTNCKHKSDNGKKYCLFLIQNMV